VTKVSFSQDVEEHYYKKYGEFPDIDIDGDTSDDPSERITSYEDVFKLLNEVERCRKEEDDDSHGNLSADADDAFDTFCMARKDCRLPFCTAKSVMILPI
jgi:hypothetical protein